MAQTDKTKNLFDNGTLLTDTVQDAHTRQTLAVTFHRIADDPVLMGAIGASTPSKEMYGAATKRIAELIKDPEEK